MNKTTYVKAKFRPVGNYVIKNVPTGEMKKTLFGETEVTVQEKVWEQTGYSDCEIDGELLTNHIQQAIDNLNGEGYEVVSITPIISGSYKWQYEAGGISSKRRGVFDVTESVSGNAGYGFGYGYSFTEGVMIVSKKINN